MLLPMQKFIVIINNILQWLIETAWTMLQDKHSVKLFKHSAKLFKLLVELLVFSWSLESLAECFKSFAERFKGSTACFETNSQLSLLINIHI